MGGWAGDPEARGPGGNPPEARATKYTQKALSQTEDEYKSLMPEACQPSWISIRKDCIFKHMFQAQYDHEHMDALDDLDIIKWESLPRELRGKTKNAVFGESATDLQQEKALERVLRWAWSKHHHFWGIERPAWTTRVEGDLD